jgi:hypothetical protein
VPAWLQEKVKDLPDGPLCPGRLGRRYRLYNTLEAAFDGHVCHSGISGVFTPHSLWHLYASVMLVEGDIDITEVARFLGHRNINVTYAIYGHLLPDANDRAIAALDTEYEWWSNADKKASRRLAARWPLPFPVGAIGRFIPAEGSPSHGLTATRRVFVGMVAAFRYRALRLDDE